MVGVDADQMPPTAARLRSVIAGSRPSMTRPDVGEPVAQPAVSGVVTSCLC